MGLASRCPGEKRGHAVPSACSRYKILPHRLIWDCLISRWMVWTTVSLVQEGSMGEMSLLWLMPWPSLIFPPLQKDAVHG